MNFVRRTLELDPATDERLRALAAERGLGEAAVLAEAIALLDSIVEIDAPDIAEDRLRLQRFRTSHEAVPLAEVRTWVESWGTAEELPPPSPRRIG